MGILPMRWCRLFPFTGGTPGLRIRGLLRPELLYVVRRGVDVWIANVGIVMLDRAAFMMWG